MKIDSKNTKEQIKELRAEVKRLGKLVHHDSLTGVLNRQGLKEHAEPFFKRTVFSLARPEKRIDLRIRSFSVLFIDIDDFKDINDDLGHQVGDDTLKKVVSIVKRIVRNSDFVSRWGGEEIVVALLGPSEQGAKVIAGKILKNIEKKAKIETPYGERDVTVSIGIAGIGPEVANIEDLIARADKAMYVAKRDRGKNNVVCHSEINK